MSAENGREKVPWQRQEHKSKKAPLTESSQVSYAKKLETWRKISKEELLELVHCRKPSYSQLDPLQATTREARCTGRA